MSWGKNWELCMPAAAEGAEGAEAEAGMSCRAVCCGAPRLFPSSLCNVARSLRFPSASSCVTGAYADLKVVGVQCVGVGGKESGALWCGLSIVMRVEKI